MFRNVFGRFVTETVRADRSLAWRVAAAPLSVRSFSGVKDEEPRPFDASLLDFLVCPLSKKPLRYEAKTNELINEELGIAYPIIDGIPNMIPQEARLLQKDTSSTPTQD
ncbi:protein preY, mitochondrial [Pempheris klunzingeri]|uniref:protein preY, mitochondrial n=1 Tax=Pempheris klunzingeri TaxID=3127111 RepID=UPI003980622C